MAAQELCLLRCRFALPLKSREDERIEDAYVLWREASVDVGSAHGSSHRDDSELLAIGPWSEGLGHELLAKHGALRVLEPGRGFRRVARAEALPNPFQGCALPGFVKAHGHDEETPIIGLVKDVPLTRWLDGVVTPFVRFLTEQRGEIEAELGMSPHRVAYLKARLDDLHYGITSSMVHHCNYSKYHVDELVEVNAEVGTRMIVAIGAQDRNYYEGVLDKPFTQAIERLDRAYARHGQRERVQVIPGPDQLFSNGPEMLKASKAWARERGLPMHCHSSEEKATTEWFKKTYGCSPVEYAHSLGVLDERTILAHQCQSTERDLEILAETGAKIVHNPLANTILGSGMPPLIEMRERGIPVAVSTDGSASADNQNIIAAARLASQYQKAAHKNAALIPAGEALRMITSDAADVLGLNGGRLRVGGPADITILDLRRPNLRPTTRESLVENIIWASDGSEVISVIANGRLLRDGDRFLSLDRDGILEAIDSIAARFERYRATHTEVHRGTGANRT